METFQPFITCSSVDHIHLKWTNHRFPQKTIQSGCNILNLNYSWINVLIFPLLCNVFENLELSDCNLILSSSPFLHTKRLSIKVLKIQCLKCLKRKSLKKNVHIKRDKTMCHVRLWIKTKCCLRGKQPLQIIYVVSMKPLLTDAARFTDWKNLKPLFITAFHVIHFCHNCCILTCQPDWSDCRNYSLKSQS